MYSVPLLGSRGFWACNWAIISLRKSFLPSSPLGLVGSAVVVDSRPLAPAAAAAVVVDGVTVVMVPRFRVGWFACGLGGRSGEYVEERSVRRHGRRLRVGFGLRAGGGIGGSRDRGGLTG